MTRQADSEVILERAKELYPEARPRIISGNGPQFIANSPLPLGGARRLVDGYVEHYNNVRPNSAIGYITAKDMLAGRQREIQAERDRSSRRCGNSASFAGRTPLKRSGLKILRSRPPFSGSLQIKS